MSQNHSILALSIAAAVAITAQTFVDATGNVVAAAANSFGVARTDGAIGDLVPVDVLGSAVVTAGGAIAAGAYVEVGANGKAVTHAAGAVVGIALEAAAADGDDVEIYLLPNHP